MSMGVCIGGGVGAPGTKKKKKEGLWKRFLDVKEFDLCGFFPSASEFLLALKHGRWKLTQVCQMKIEGGFGYVLYPETQAQVMFSSSITLIIFP